MHIEGAGDGRPPPSLGPSGGATGFVLLDKSDGRAAEPRSPQNQLVGQSQSPPLIPLFLSCARHVSFCSLFGVFFPDAVQADKLGFLERTPLTTTLQLPWKVAFPIHQIKADRSVSEIGKFRNSRLSLEEIILSSTLNQRRNRARVKNCLPGRVDALEVS